VLVTVPDSPGRDLPAERELAALLHAYAAAWGAVDFAAAAGCWDAADPEPVYVGLEYPAPLIGWADLDRHWARLGARVKAAALAWEDVQVRIAAPGLAAVVALSVWEVESVESPTRHHGQSWVSLLARRRAEGWRICQFVESPAYFADRTTEESG
jgi:hypothetical protein